MIEEKSQLNSGQFSLADTGNFMASNILLYNIFNILVLVQLISAFFTFVLLFFVDAPYGKHSSKKWGFQLSARLGWILMEFPAFAVILSFFIAGVVTKSIFASGASIVVLICFIAIWEVHYFNRTFIYPFLIKKSKSMSFVIPLLGAIFNTVNGFNVGYYLFSGRQIFFEGTIFEQNLSTLYSINYLYDIRFILGVAIFAFGMVVNLHSDYVLRSLRKDGGSGYKVPNRGFHKLLANPNYFGEFCEWIGFSVMTWSIPAFAFAIFTFANLAPRAYRNLKWYRKNFGEDYPKSRKAIIPFLF